MEKIMLSIVATDNRGHFIPGNWLAKMLPDIECYLTQLSGGYTRVMDGVMFDEFNMMSSFSQVQVIGKSEKRIMRGSIRTSRFETLEEAYATPSSALYFVSTTDELLKKALELSGYVVVIRLNEMYRAFATPFVLEEENYVRTLSQGRYSNSRGVNYRITIYRSSKIDDVLPPDFWRAPPSTELSKLVKKPIKFKKPKKSEVDDKTEESTSEDERNVHVTAVTPGKHKKGRITEAAGA